MPNLHTASAAREPFTHETRVQRGRRPDCARLARGPHINRSAEPEARTAGRDDSNGRVFFDSWGDGMAVDQQGNVYLTGPGGGVLIINANGEHLGSLLAPPRTSNATFGEDGSTMFITANTRLVRIGLNVKGVGF